MSETARPTRQRHAVIAWFTLAAIIGYVCRNCIGVAEETIREDVGLTLEQSGWFMGAFFWSYALLQVPAGIVGRAWGTRRTLTACAVAWSLAIAILGTSPWTSRFQELLGLPATSMPLPGWMPRFSLPFVVLIVAQLLMGTAQAGMFPASVQSVRKWIPERTRATSSAFLSGGMQVGAVIAAMLTGFLIVRVPWEYVFVAYAVPGLLWAILFHRSFRDRPEEHPGVNDAELRLIRGTRADEDSPTERTAKPDRSGGEWAAILTSPSIWFLCSQQAFRGAGYAFFATWFPTFLKETRGVSTAGSGVSQGAVFAATLVGSLFAGALVDAIYRRTGRLRLSRSGVGAAAMALCGLLILSAYFVHSPIGAVALLAAGAFMAACGGPTAYVVTIDLGGRSVPQVFGLMNMSGNLAAAITPILLGMLFAESTDWNLVLFLFAGMYGVAAVCWCLVDPARCVDPEETEP